MATPELKGFDCIDHDPINEWIPDSDTDVHYSLCLHIGTSGEPGADLFYIDVYTPQTINEHNLGKSVDSRSIVVNPYTWDEVMKKVHVILAECSADDWEQQSALLAKHFHWEFENYQPHKA